MPPIEILHCISKDDLLGLIRVTPRYDRLTLHEALGCGFDFEEKRATGKYIMANYEKDAGQTIIVTHELEILDQIPVIYWMILDDTHQVYSMKTANSAFKDFMSCGLNNHNLFTDEMYM